MINTSQIEKHYILNKNRITNYWCGVSFFVERDGVYVKYPFYNFQHYTTDELITDILLQLRSNGNKKISFNPIDEKDELKISTDCSSIITFNNEIIIEAIEVSDLRKYETPNSIDLKSKKDIIRKVLLEKGIL